MRSIEELTGHAEVVLRTMQPLPRRERVTAVGPRNGAEVGIIVGVTDGVVGVSASYFTVRRLDGSANPIGDSFKVYAFLLGLLGHPGHGKLTTAIPNYKVGDFLRFARQRIPTGIFAAPFIDDYWTLDTLQESCP